MVFTSTAVVSSPLTSPTQEGPLNMKEWMMVNFKLGETNLKVN